MFSFLCLECQSWATSPLWLPNCDGPAIKKIGFWLLFWIHQAGKWHPYMNLVWYNTLFKIHFKVSNQVGKTKTRWILNFFSHSMQMSYDLDNFSDYWGIFDDYDEDVFLLDLRRATILEDTFEQLADACDTDYKKPLRVKTTRHKPTQNVCIVVYTLLHKQYFGIQQILFTFYNFVL